MYYNIIIITIKITNNGGILTNVKMNLNCRLLKMTQEVGTVEAVEGSLDVSLYPIGSFLRIMPYHVSRVLSSILTVEIYIFYCCTSMVPFISDDLIASLHEHFGND